MSQSEWHCSCSLFFSLLVVFVWLGFLAPRQIITSMHLVPCSSALWCDTAKCVKYKKASVVPEEDLSAQVTHIYVPVLLVLVR